MSELLEQMLADKLSEGGARPTLFESVGGKVRRAPRTSNDLKRILALPRRAVTDDDRAAMVTLMSGRLRRDINPPGQCYCASIGRPCILELKPTQAWALYEIGLVGGLVGPIGVGQGKTGLDLLTPMVMRECRTAVLLIPPSLVSQLKMDYLLWREHWRVPTMVVRTTLIGAEADAPVVHVLPYSRLSRPESSVILESLEPDTIIADEAHMLRNATAARTMRVLRHFVAFPQTRLCAWSGTLVNNSIKDYAHLAAIALRDQSPLPLSTSSVAEWTASLDPPAPGQSPAPPGALSSLCNPGEKVREGFHRRFIETRGVVATRSSGIDASLYMHNRDPGKVPDVIREALRSIRGSWIRPDGEEFIDAFSMNRCAREAAAGFYYVWEFPRGENKELIEEWFKRRGHWRWEAREQLKNQRPHMDSPMLLALAAKRQIEGYKGPLPTWRSQYWSAWNEIKGDVRPKSKAIWMSDYLVNDAAEWASKNLGIVWYEHVAFGRRVAEVAGLPLHDGGSEAGARIAAETGDRSVIASIHSHGTGRDGLQFLFDRQLIANPPESRATGGAAKWEQLLGRLHREGQKADDVHTDMYRHTSEMREAWDRARQLARYVRETMGSFQKLLACSETWNS